MNLRSQYDSMIAGGASLQRPAVVDVSRLMPRTRTPLEATSDPRRTSQAVYEPARYGDMQLIPIPLGVGGETLALARPANTRIFLIVQNNTAGNITYTFDQQADAGNGIILLPGQSMTFDDIVPQNDLHVFSAVGGTVMVGFINSDIANRQA